MIPYRMSLDVSGSKKRNEEKKRYNKHLILI